MSRDQLEAPTPRDGPPLSASLSDREGLVPRLLLQPVQRFLHQEAAGGIVLLVASAVALVWANSQWATGYEALFATELTVDLGVVTLTEDLAHWINDLLMAVFFFVVGLEIKRELVHGELADPRRVLLPVLAAIGGMVVPAALYLAFNAGGPGSPGWGIPMATDIAFAVGVLSLCGSRAPLGLKIFLLTLAVADDLGAILVIAVFYTADLAPGWLAVAAVTIAAVVVMQRARVRAFVPYVVAAALLWFAVYSSGVHATIAGVILGLLTPAWPFHPPEAVTGEISRRTSALARLRRDGRADEHEQTELAEVSRLAHESVSPLSRLLVALHPWSSFVVLPLFALANAGVPIGGATVGELLREPVVVGVVAGLVLGKPIGITLASLLAVRLGARLPDGVGVLELIGAGLLAGIGFTVAIFIAGLAFTDAVLTDAAKLGIFGASVAAALLGSAFLLARRTTEPRR